MLAALPLLVGCGNHDTSAPVACRAGPAAVRTALRSAPASVRVDGVRLSQCFAHAAGSAEVQETGALFVDLTQQLAARARTHPHSAEATQLGYLVGAVRRAVGKDYGVYYEAHRRVEAELVGVDQRSSEFVSGERAGERTG